MADKEAIKALAEYLITRSDEPSSHIPSGRLVGAGLGAYAHRLMEVASEISFDGKPTLTSSKELARSFSGTATTPQSGQDALKHFNSCVQSKPEQPKHDDPNMEGVRKP